MDVLIAGDFCPSERVAKKIDNNEYDDIFSEIKPLVTNVDISLLNFECPIVIHDAKPIFKQGPNLKCTSNAAKAVKEAGFKLVTLANNHINDYGETGIKDTLETFNNLELYTVGAGMNINDASKIFYYKKNGEICAFINCCEREFSIATDKCAGANALDPVSQWYIIQEAKQQANYVVMIVHAGHEHCQLPSERMQDTFRFFIDNGVDAIVTHHQHCYSGYEIYKGKPIVYGIGNFCFDERASMGTLWNEGYMVTLHLNSISPEIALFPYIQCGEEPKIKLFSKASKKQFIHNIHKLNEIIADRHLLHQSLVEKYRETEDSYAMALQPYTSKVLLSMFSRGFLPNLFSTKKYISYLNYIQCDSHRDRLIQYLKDKIYK